MIFFFHSSFFLLIFWHCIIMIEGPFTYIHVICVYLVLVPCTLSTHILKNYTIFNLTPHLTQCTITPEMAVVKKRFCCCFMRKVATRISGINLFRGTNNTVGDHTMLVRGRVCFAVSFPLRSIEIVKGIVVFFWIEICKLFTTVVILKQFCSIPVSMQFFVQCCRTPQ